MARAKIARTFENAKDLYDEYHTDVAGFMTDIVRLDLDGWQKEICDEFHNYDRFAISSGHSSGKSALAAGLNIFFLTMHPHPQAITTANTELQLKQKTWRELAKWHKRSLVSDWFVWSATKYAMREAEDTWFAAAVPQTEHNSEAFAGAHEKYILQIFDEASLIPQSIYDVAEGATPTDGGYRKWFLFGNPTLNTGPFYDACFGNRTHRWRGMILDARECKYADQEQIKDWAEDYGEDSDFFRVRAKGLPPKQSITTLIGAELAESAAKRNLPEETYRFAPKILSVDCARFGDDETTLTFRQGLKCHWQRSYRDLDEMEIAQKVSDAINDENPTQTFFDITGGYGAGAHDRLRQLGYKALGVNFATTKGVDGQYQNMRMSMWDNMRKWLETGSIPDDPQLVRDMTTPEYHYNIRTGKKQLEAKETLKKRLGRSPDRADSLAISFAYPVRPAEPERFFTQAEKDWRKLTGTGQGSGRVASMDS
ncbi:MAG: terminase [Gammaproteobacteria bacterium]|nr:terminase [Gammaproteobacteria bacterium]